MAGSARHDWRIEEREYERHRARRGRRHAFESVDPSTTALVVVDLVDFFFATGNPYLHGIVPQVNTLAGGVREAGGVVAWVVPGETEPTAVQRELYGAEAAETYARSGGSGVVRDRVWHELDIDDSDLFAEKTAASAFFPGASDLPARLGERGIETVVVAGTVTNVCVEATVRDASTLGHRVILVADACAAVRDRDHNATLHTVYRTFGDVRTTAEVLGLLRGQVAPDD
ncbi:cysteine hydrolase [Nocardioides euryhalodurans]|uniref:Cysteine hydrolase n=1 Tax=Nocardioides euryhalodurans TaxID=2518370 RepID=A0A4P7GIU2_9ACTN|nr:cysteine hydrolase [Nocardioides euryhalodurans]QBR91918.1 cysteine hydrolase [Nocardioides euryhalodurans]